MKIFGLIAAAAMLCASAANAETIMPPDVQFEDGKVLLSLTGVAGDPVTGRKVFSNRKLGNCLACHLTADLSEESFHGEVGPEMAGVADRWEAAELRGILVDAKMMFGDTIMPAFYRNTGFTRPLKAFEGKTILTAQQVEDVLAYLQTLKEE